MFRYSKAQPRSSPNRRRPWLHTSLQSHTELSFLITRVTAQVKQSTSCVRFNISCRNKLAYDEINLPVVGDCVFLVNIYLF